MPSIAPEAALPPVSGLPSGVWRGQCVLTRLDPAAAAAPATITASLGGSRSPLRRITVPLEQPGATGHAYLRAAEALLQHLGVAERWRLVAIGATEAGWAFTYATGRRHSGCLPSR